MNIMDELKLTDELRRFANEWDWLDYKADDSARELRAIADRIDAEHQKALDEWKAKHGQMWLRGYAECHAELLEGNETLAADLESCGWIRLPKDADGDVEDVLEGFMRAILNQKPELREENIAKYAAMLQLKEDA